MSLQWTVVTAAAPPWCSPTLIETNLASLLPSPVALVISPYFIQQTLKSPLRNDAHLSTLSQSYFTHTIHSLGGRRRNICRLRLWLVFAFGSGNSKSLLRSWAFIKDGRRPSFWRVSVNKANRLNHILLLLWEPPLTHLSVSAFPHCSSTSARSIFPLFYPPSASAGGRMKDILTVIKIYSLHTRCTSWSWDDVDIDLSVKHINGATHNLATNKASLNWTWQWLLSRDVRVRRKLNYSRQLDFVMDMQWC